MPVLKQKDKRHYIFKLETERDAVRKPSEERKRNLEESLITDNPDAQEMLQRLKEANAGHSYRKTISFISKS